MLQPGLLYEVTKIEITAGKPTIYLNAFPYSMVMANFKRLEHHNSQFNLIEWKSSIVAQSKLIQSFQDICWEKQIDIPNHTFTFLSRPNHYIYASEDDKMYQIDPKTFEFTTSFNIDGSAICVAELTLQYLACSVVDDGDGEI